MSRAEAEHLFVGCTLLLALADLSERQRHAVIARFWRGLPITEIAAEMGVSKQAVSQLTISGVAHLARLLGPYRDRLAA